MDACLAVEHEVDKVLSKFEDMSKSYNVVLQQLIDDLETMKNDLQTNSINEGEILTMSSFSQLMSVTIKIKTYSCLVHFYIHFFILTD